MLVLYIYLTEIATVKLRGVKGNFNNLSLNIGAIAGLAIGAYLDIYEIILGNILGFNPYKYALKISLVSS